MVKLDVKFKHITHQRRKKDDMGIVMLLVPLYCINACSRKRILGIAYTIFFAAYLLLSSLFAYNTRPGSHFCVDSCVMQIFVISVHCTG